MLREAVVETLSALSLTPHLRTGQIISKIALVARGEKWVSQAAGEVLAYTDYWDHLQESGLPAEEANRRLAEAENAVIEEIRSKGYCFDSSYHQSGDFGTPLLDNGMILFCYMRQWGRLMYLAENPNGTDPMGYCRYFLGDIDPAKVKLPTGKADA